MPPTTRDDDSTELDRRPIEAVRQQAEDHSTSGPHDRGGHSVVNDWDLKVHLCVDCGLVSRSATAIEAEPCEPQEADQ